MIPCPVHPHRTGGEVKLIGLLPRYPGQPADERYAEWRTEAGDVCTCEKAKPFAETVEYIGGNDWWSVRTAGMSFGQMTRAVADDTVARINAAVEKREAKLRGALKELIGFSRGLTEAIHDQRDRSMHGSTWGWPDPTPTEQAADAASAALDGGGPDYVPAAALRAAEEKLRQLTAAFDVLESRGLDATGRVVREFLVASGLVEPLPQSIEVEKGRRIFLTTPDGRTVEFVITNVEVNERHFGVADVYIQGSGNMRPAAKTAPNAATTGPVVNFTHPVHALADRILAQHEQVCDELMSRFRFDNGVRRTVDHPGGAVFRLDTFTVGPSTYIVETRMDADAHARTTTRTVPVISSAAAP